MFFKTKQFVFVNCGVTKESNGVILSTVKEFLTEGVLKLHSPWLDFSSADTNMQLAVLMRITKWLIYNLTYLFIKMTTSQSGKFVSRNDVPYITYSKFLKSWARNLQTF